MSRSKNENEEYTRRINMDNINFASSLLIGDATVKEVPCLVANGEPSSDLGVTGCLYMDKETGNIYKKTQEGVWKEIGGSMSASSNGAVQQPLEVESFNINNDTALSADYGFEPITNPVSAGASGEYSAVFGGKSAALGKRAFASGSSNVARGKTSHVSGTDNVAIGDNSDAKGWRTIAIGSGSSSKGRNTIAGGAYSNAEGINNWAKQECVHVEGINNKVEGYAAHGEGANNTIGPKGEAAHVSGRYNKANHMGADVAGVQNESGRDYQAIVGQYAKYSSDAMFIVGCGNGDPSEGATNENRKNGLMVLLDGIVILGQDGNHYKISVDTNGQLTTQKYIFPA
jgi:hypothetical protein